MAEQSIGEIAEQLRRTAFPLVYRMIGSVAEAEDLVQEGLLRYETAVQQGASVRNPHAFIVSITTRLAIDHLKSARVKREVYPGEWLPEPIVQNLGQSVPERAEMAESLSLAFMVLLETLSPLERAVFLLRQVFDYEYAEIADVVGKSESNCRQVFSRAKKSISTRRPRFEPTETKSKALARQFFVTCQTGSLPELESMLAADVEFHGDGGGVASAVQKPVIGPASVARLMRGIFQQARSHNLRYVDAEINGEPGLLVTDTEGALVSVMSVQVADERITSFHSIINPDKLQHLGRVSDLARLKKRSEVVIVTSHSERGRVH